MKQDLVVETPNAREQRYEQTGHTPTPWSYGYQRQGMAITLEIGSEREQIAFLYSLNGQPSVANAEFIVRVVNSHETLLEACQNIANEIEHWKHEAPPTREMRQGCIDELRAAIAKAEGK